MSHLEKLLQQVAAITPEQIAELTAAGKIPDKEIQPGERLIGVISEGTQRFYHLFSLTAKAVNPRLVEIRHELELLEAKEELTPERRLELEIEKKRLKRGLDRINEMFWDEVHEEHPSAYGIDSLAIRAGWQLVEAAPQKAEVPRGLMGGLLPALLLGGVLRGGGCEDPNCPVCNR